MRLNSAHPEPRLSLGKAYIVKSMYEEGISEMKKAVELSQGDPRYKAELAWAYAVARKREAAIKIANELKRLSKRERVPPMAMALVHTALDQWDGAFAWLEKAYDEHSSALLEIRWSPEFESLRSDPRFQDLLRRLGLGQ